MSEPERVGDIAMRVLVELLDREFPVTEGVSEAEECDNGGKAKGRIALTNPTLLATISIRPKGA